MRNLLMFLTLAFSFIFPACLLDLAEVECVNNQECPTQQYCCQGMCQTAEELTAACYSHAEDGGFFDDSGADTSPDTPDGGDTSTDAPDGSDTSLWPDVGQDGEGDTLPDTDVNRPDGSDDTDTEDTDVDSGGDTVDGDTDTPPVCGDDVCEDDETCEADCGSPETFGRYVANFTVEDLPNVDGLNPGIRPTVEVRLPGIGWSRVAAGGEFFPARADLEGMQWRITVPNMPGETGCAEQMILPECRGEERICHVTWPAMVSRDWQDFTVDEGGSPRVVTPTYQCVWSVEDLPTTPEVFCPTTSTIIRISEEEGVRDLFCVEPLYLAVSREILTQCRDQRSDTEYGLDCGLTTRSFLSGDDDPIWTVEQRIQATGTTRRFEIRP